MREQVEVLEHHAHLSSYKVYVSLAVGDVFTFNADTSACRLFHKVKTTQERTFSRAGRTYDNYLFAFVDMLVYPVEDVEITKRFTEILNVYHSCQASSQAASEALSE